MRDNKPAVAIANVDILASTELGVMCRTRGREVWVGALQIPSGAIRPTVGLGRTLVLYRDAALELELIV